MDTRKIDDLIASYEKRLSMLRQLKGLISSDPELAAEVIQSFGGNGTSSTSPKNGQFERMVQLMQDGRWLTLVEIADGIGAKKTSLAPFFYRDATKNRFESRKHPDNTRMFQWRLRQQQSQGDAHEKS